MSNSVAATFHEFVKPRLNKQSVAFLACLFLSGLFWLLTSLSKKYVDEIRVPVTYVDLPENLLIVNDLTKEVNAEVKGLGFNLLWYWLQFEKTEIPIIANPSKLPSVLKNGEEYHYILTSHKNGQMGDLKNEQLEVIGIFPDTLFIRFEPKLRKLVPVKLRADISFVKQFGMHNQPIITPDSIYVSGPKEIIDTIRFVETKFQKWNDLLESVTATVNLVPEIGDANPLTLSQNTVEVGINVVEFTEGNVIVPLTVLAENPESVKVYPREVEIKYQVALSAYDNVDAEGFEVSVSLNEDNRKRARLIVNIDRQPDFVRQVRVSPSQVDFIIQK